VKGIAVEGTRVRNQTCVQGERSPIKGKSNWVLASQKQRSKYRLGKLSTGDTGGAVGFERGSAKGKSWCEEFCLRSASGGIPKEGIWGKTRRPRVNLRVSRGSRTESQDTG